MEGFFMLLGFLGLLLIPVAIIYLIITLMRKTFSKKVFWWMFIGGFLLLIVGLIISPSEKAENKEGEEATDEIDVKIDLNESDKDGMVIFDGTVNLPDGAELLVTLSNDDGFRAQSKTNVENGDYKTEQFTNQGDQLETGTYTVEVTMGIASTQPESVQEVIGEESEYLKGDLVKDGELGKTVKYTKTIEIDGAETEDHNASMKEYKENLKSYYEELNTTYESQSESLDLEKWGEFAREFRKDTDALKDKMKSSSLNQSETIEITPVVANLQYLLTAYAADLDGREDDDEIKRLKDEIEEVVGK